MNPVRFQRTNPLAVIPARANPTDTGLDLVSVEKIALSPGTFHAFDTGWKIALPEGYEGQVRPRSGLAAKKGVTVLNAPGSIDVGYRGPLKVILINHGPGVVDVNVGDKIAQLVVAPVCLPDAVEVEELDVTDRGENGFGSSGR